MEPDAAIGAGLPATVLVPAPAAGVPRVGPRPSWRRSYARGLVVSDAAVVTAAAGAGVAAGPALPELGVRLPFVEVDGLSYVLLAAGLVAGWMLVLQWIGARDRRVVGDGVAEYRRVLYATSVLLGWVAILALALKVDVSRAFLLQVLLTGTGGLMVSRKAWRVWLRRERAVGRSVTRVLVLGGRRGAEHLARALGDPASTGLQVVGALVLDGTAAPRDLVVEGRQVPVHGRGCALSDALARTGASMVVVTDTERLGPQGLKDLTWQLSGTEVELMLAPQMAGVSDARLHLTTVAAMPFVHVEEPTYAQADRWAKVFFDRALSVVLLVLFLPVLVAAAVAVRLSGPGPVLYRQERIGRDGIPFELLKLRSMRVGADADLEALLEEVGEELGPGAKLADDPRVTPAGRFLRRFSIDELPQLLNVLGGQMSLVGPRPQRRFEVEAYDEVAHRRLRVRPGMTGLWQVSGRNDLSWEDTVRLDTFYVENWSMTADLMILWRTTRAVLFYRGPS